MILGLNLYNTHASFLLIPLTTKSAVVTLFTNSILLLRNRIHRDDISRTKRKRQQHILPLLCCHCQKWVEITLGKAGLVDGHHRIRISEVGQDIGAQFVTNAVLIPDGISQEALHAIGAAFSGLFGELPSIFARHITQDALEVQEATMAGVRSSHIGGHTCVAKSEI